MPEYCTELIAFAAVMRASNERVSPSSTVRESEASTTTVPGPSIELREAVPYCPVGEATNAAVLNQLPIVRWPLIGVPKFRFGRNELLTPDETSCTVNVEL